MPKEHLYSVGVNWTGNQGQGTLGYASYSRDHEIVIQGKPPIAGSSDPTFRGDATRHNPEEMLVASLSACHMLWYLHLCSEAGIVVTDYRDNASGTMVETEDGSGKFASVILRPLVTVTPESDASIAKRLHEKAHHLCFIANSVNFPVDCEPAVSNL